MSFGSCKGLAMVGLMLLFQGCAVVPFVPEILHVVPRLVDPGHGRPSAAVQEEPADPPAPAFAQTKATAPAATADDPPADAGAGTANSSGAPGIVAQRDSAPLLTDGTIPMRLQDVDLVSDIKAHAVGDVITVNVAESINGETKAQTNLANKRSLDAGIPNLLTATESLALHNPFLNLADMVNGSSENDATGAGDMTANDTFTAKISAMVVAVNPSGTLTIRGRRYMRINGEDDTIEISGIVRPQDIDSNNSVSSNDIADLRLSLTGFGLVRDKQGDGIGSRLMDWLWLF